MCTLTLIPLGDGLRLAHSRDESRERPAALPPRLVRPTGGPVRRALMPIDPGSGGTWVAVTDAGLALAILNVNPPSLPQPAGADLPRSRGLIIPALVGADDLDEAVWLACGLCPFDFRPFRLVLAMGREVAEVVWDGQRLVTRRQRCEGPLMFTSSGLGDHQVLAPRSALFAAVMARGEPTAQQAAFHRHSWPDRPHLSVCMRRTDACTVSLTTVDLTEQFVRMHYHPTAPDEAARGVTARLALLLAAGVN